MVAHTADVIVEAWGPDFTGCCEEAVTALLALCIDGSGAEIIDRHVVSLRPLSQESMLLDLLDETIFVLDTVAAVPVGAEVRPQPDGGIEVSLMLAERESVEVIGPAPKAISRSGFLIENDPDLVRCAFLIDV